MATKKSAAKKAVKTAEFAPNKVEIRFNSFGFKLSPKQLDFIERIESKENKISFICGEAGSSKSFIAIFAALKLLKAGEADGIVYVRAAVESASRSLGYMQGSFSDKLSHYLYPLEDKLEELLIPSDKIDLMSSGLIEANAVGFLRGRSFNNKIVILDEANQLTMPELETVITRIGEGSKLVLCGDFRQRDVRGSGFEKVVNLFDDEESRDHGFDVMRFNSDDIVRSEAVKYAVKKFESLTNQKGDWSPSGVS